MNIYLVGGAVRDELLGLAVKDRDWLVVNASIEDMLAKNYRPVGNDFPVFLHPTTHEEYALARSEKKVAKGYKGFKIYTDPSITLEQDLGRRDLTINAIAKDKNGKLIDPYGGLLDIKAKCLRHVSPAFKEDPLRVLRTAKFAARFHHLGFRIADETVSLLKEISHSDELINLAQERIWQEIEQALETKTPHVFFEVLQSCGALTKILPEIGALFGVPQNAKHHPEIDSGIHSLMVLNQACLLTNNKTVRLAALCHDLGKALTKQDKWPEHPDHEVAGKKAIKRLFKRLNIPKSYWHLAMITSELHFQCHCAFELNEYELLNLLKKADCFRKPEVLQPLLLCCIADHRGRTGFENTAYPQATFLKKIFKACQTVNSKSIDQSKFKGINFGQELDRQRLTQINRAINHKTSNTHYDK